MACKYTFEDISWKYIYILQFCAWWLFPELSWHPSFLHRLSFESPHAQLLLGIFTPIRACSSAYWHQQLLIVWVLTICLDWSLQLEVIFCHLNCKAWKCMYTSFPFFRSALQRSYGCRLIYIYIALTAANNAKDWEYCEKATTLKCNVIVLDKRQAVCIIKHAMYVTMATLLFHPCGYGDKKHKINLPEVGRHRTSGIVSAIRTFAKSLMIIM